MVAEDLQDLLQETELEDSDLIQIISESPNKQNSDSSDTEDDSETHELTVKDLQKGMSLAKNLESFFLNADPSAERRLKFKRELENCMLPYKQIYKKLSNKQSKLTDFFKKQPQMDAPQKRARLTISSDEEQI
ncbi:PREDICTED: uncharacterized protein LOC108365105 [Rhagoletis zephyria]|uniref:uncharacterized protein LOC108365105 n=1 Tax=Rhagoletis zephyria TaxID=28612 RepID=UPI00081198E9|nr:PREDICTED: uncharacterized protein LOC108365105 [Rhagoletis zephyria]